MTNDIDVAVLLGEGVNVCSKSLFNVYHNLIMWGDQLYSISPSVATLVALLLGCCYFFRKKYSDEIKVVVPITQHY